MGSTVLSSAAGDRTSARLVTIGEEEAGRRLDNFLMSQLRGMPRTHVYRMIRSGQVRVNSGRAGADRRLLVGDRVRIPPLRLPADAGPPVLRPGTAAWVEARILYEDKTLLVLDKPAGLAAHGGSGVSLGAIELLRAARPHERNLGLVHRLDRETSGCLLFSRTPSALRHLQAQFRGGTVEKTYLALLTGTMRAAERLVDAPLHTAERRGGERHVRVDPAGKEAQTRFIAERRYPGATLVRALPLTGRTHQIRVHAASMDLPLAGDTRYGYPEHELERRIGLQRLFLHAASLAFDSPIDERVIRVESPLPEDLAAVLQRMRTPSESSAPLSQSSGSPSMAVGSRVRTSANRAAPRDSKRKLPAQSRGRSRST